MICNYCRQEFNQQRSFYQLFSWQSQPKQQLCLACQQRFPKIVGPTCPQCQRPGSKQLCSDCRYWQQVYQGQVLINHAVYRYDSSFHDLMVQYKRRGDYVLHQVLAELAAKDLRQLQADYYVAVPSSPEHYQRRKFDAVAAVYQNLVTLTPALIKRAGSQAQGEKDRNGRLKTPQSFQRNPACRQELTGNVLLLDDIYTTGRTLYHARDALIAAWPEIKITSFTICR